MGTRYGALPIIQLPQDNELLIGFVQELAELLKDKGLYRRDQVIVVPYEDRRRLVQMEAKAFCTWLQHYVATCKQRYDKQGDPYNVYKDVPTEAAEKTLLSWDFWPKIPEIDAVHPAPMPALRGDELVMMEEGYDEASRTYTFKLA